MFKKLWQAIKRFFTSDNGSDNVKPHVCEIDNACDAVRDVDDSSPPVEIDGFTPKDLRGEYLKLWETMFIKTICGSNGCQVESTIAWSVNRILKYQERYKRASELIFIKLRTRVPWQIIAVLHMRESGCDFNKQILNGQSWKRRTTWVPKGYGPWSTWEESCVTAFEIKELPKTWTIANTLYFCERFNGMGYRQYRSHIVGQSPYVFAYSQHYKGGYYYADGKFSETRIAKGVGCAILLKELGYNGD